MQRSDQAKSLDNRAASFLGLLNMNKKWLIQSE